MSNDTTFDPKSILANSKQLNPQHIDYKKHEMIQRFGNPQQAIYIDQSSVEIDGIEYDRPFILPIYNAQLELIQCAVLADQQRVQVIPDGYAKGFAYYGKLQPDQPVIVTHHLETFFKVAQTNYAVVLVVLPTLCTASLTKLKNADFEKIRIVVEQLQEAGYSHLYMPVRPEEIKRENIQDLEKNTALRLLNQYLIIDDDGIQTEYLVELYKEDLVEDVQIFLDESIQRLPPISQLPEGHLAKPYKLDENNHVYILQNGLVHMKEQQLENGEVQKKPILISPPIVILGEARSVSNDNWKRVIQFKDKDQKEHTLLIPYEYFMGEATDALRLIANHGLMPPRQNAKKQIFIQYLQAYPIQKRFRCVERTGWHTNHYVTPTQTYGDTQAEGLLFHHEGRNPYSVQGSFTEWQALSRLIEPHALAVLAFSCAFSGQLVEPLGVESGGFHIYGSSTDGKSTITKAACSIWGNPKDISKSWRTTDNALENEAELRNDHFLNLDELRQAAPKAVSDIIYMLTGGQGKARSNKVGKNRDLKQFNLIYSSTGEVTLEEHLRRGNIELDAGLLLRFAHLPSDAGYGHGVFEQLSDGQEPQALANQLNSLANQHYGHAGHKWLEFMTKNKSAVIEEAQAVFEQFITQHAHCKNGQAQRVLRRFALVAAAGELATQAGITAWQQGRASAALSQCFSLWLNSLGNSSNFEERKVLEHIKGFFEAHGTSRFESLLVRRHADGEIIQSRIHNRVGYYDPEAKSYLISPTMFKQEMCIGFNEAYAKKVLIKHGWIQSFSEAGKTLYVKKSSSCLPDGTRPRMMHFNIEVMQQLDL